MKQLLTSLILCISISSLEAQIAPDFTLTDINGQTHNLYDYLDEGKTVILDFYAVWCGPCQANAAGVEEVWQDLGPDGTNEIMILGIEGDDDSTDDQVANYALEYDCQNPQINSSESVMDLYDVSYYPTYFVVCPDKSYQEYDGIPTTIETELLIGIEQCAPVLDLEVDARIFSYNSSTILCSAETTPNFTLMNMGQQALTSLEVNLFLNGDLLSTTDWSGSLEQFEFEFITLETIDLAGITDPEITVTLENPNGEQDPNPTNDSTTVLVEYGGATYNTNDVRLELYFDNFPQETDWEISNSIGEVLASGGDYVGFPDFSPPIDTLLTLEPGDCYTFTIYDTFGDGICCAFADEGEGFWKLTTDSDEIIGEGGVFLDQESAIFGVDNDSQVLSNKETQLNVFPNPTQDTFTIQNADADYSWEILSLDGRLIKKGKESSQTSQIDVSSITARGNYMLIIKSNSSIQTFKLILE